MRTGRDVTRNVTHPWSTPRRRRGRAIVPPLVLAALFVAAQGAADVKAQTSPDSLEIRGDDEMLGVMQQLVESYMGAHQEATVVVIGNDAERGQKALVVGVAEMAMAIDEVPPEIQALADERHVKLLQTEVFRDAVVPVVAKDNPITDISMKQLQDVFSGKITNWKDLGWKDSVPIEVISQDPDSGTYETFKNEVLDLGDDHVITPTAKIVDFDDYDDAITKKAIGYFGINDVGALKALTVNGVAASFDTVRSGAYPILRQSCLYTLDPPPPIAGKLIDFVFSDAGQTDITAHKFVPIARVGK